MTTYQTIKELSAFHQRYRLMVNPLSSRKSATEHFTIALMLQILKFLKQ